MSGASSVFPRHHERQSCTIVHNPKLSQSGYIFIHLHTSPGLRLGFSRLEITDSLIASDAKRSYLPDYANHLSPGCWGVGTCDPCFSCTFCVVLLLIVPGYSKSHTAVNAGYLGLGWETWGAEDVQQATDALEIQDKPSVALREITAGKNNEARLTKVDLKFLQKNQPGSRKDIPR